MIFETPAVNAVFALSFIANHANDDATNVTNTIIVATIENIKLTFAFLFLSPTTLIAPCYFTFGLYSIEVFVFKNTLNSSNGIAFA
jgi:hypothetical protein